MLEFVKVATGHNYCVYARRRCPDGVSRIVWAGTVKPTGPGVPRAPEFHPRTPMGWAEPFQPTAAESEQIKKFLLTLPGPVVQ